MGKNGMNHYSKISCFFLFLTLITAGCAGTDLTLKRQEAYQAYHAGDFGEATVKFEQLVQEMPKDAELWFRLGNSYARVQLPQKAIEAYQNALLRDPKMEKAWYNMGLIHLQAALKSYVDMQNYVRDDDPIGIKGKVMREGIFSLLGGSEGKHEKEE